MITNAIKFTSGDGQVTISYHHSSEQVYVAIRDTGPGIEPTEIERIFEKYYHSDNSYAYGYKGMGLGLYYARKFANMHKGEIKVDSRVGEGSTFTLQLPLMQVEGAKKGFAAVKSGED